MCVINAKRHNEKGNIQQNNRVTMARKNGNKKVGGEFVLTAAECEAQNMDWNQLLEFKLKKYKVSHPSAGWYAQKAESETRLRVRWVGSAGQLTGYHLQELIDLGWDIHDQVLATVRSQEAEMRRIKTMHERAKSGEWTLCADELPPVELPLNIEVELSSGKRLLCDYEIETGTFVYVNDQNRTTRYTHMEAVPGLPRVVKWRHYNEKLAEKEARQ